MLPQQLENIIAESIKREKLVLNFAILAKTYFPSLERISSLRFHCGPPPLHFLQRLGQLFARIKRLIFSDINKYHCPMKNPKRTTLLINLSVEEAEQIRAAARKQDRTISAFVLRAVMNRIRVERALEDKRTQPFFENYVERVRQQR